MFHKTTLRRSPLFLLFAGVLAAIMGATAGRAQSGAQSPDAGLKTLTAPAARPLRSFLNRDAWPGYWNYAGQPYSPTTVSVRSTELYDRLGTHLLRGYPLLSWRETRSDSVGLQESSLVRENYLFEFFGQLIVATDNYSGWNFAVIAGNNIRTSLTPLTLKKARWQGVRIDAESPKQGLTVLLTRGALNRFSAFDARRDLSPVLGYGGHYHNRINDVLTVGATLFNQHQVDVDSRRGSFVRGTQPYQMQGPREIYVRVESDAPDCGSVAGVYGMILEIDVAGDAGVVRQRISPQFLGGGRRDGDMRRVSQAGEALDYRFDLPANVHVVRAVVRADVAGDYRISVRQIHDFTVVDGGQTRTEQRAWPSPPTHTFGGPLYPLDFRPGQAQPYYTVARAAGKPGLERRRVIAFDHGIPSGKTLVGTDFKIVARELRATGEIVYDSEERHFPFASDSLRLRGRKSTSGSWAYTCNARRPLRLGGLRVELGGEVFRMDPDYSGGYDSRRGGTVFFTDRGGPSATEAFTQEFPLVDDNDDGDRYPDDAFEDGGRYTADIHGTFGATPWAGVFPGLDTDGDLTPDNDRDRNGVPDWTEPFLHYDSDPADFVYGIDFNNNTIPDYRENDDYADYPIRKDQRGRHAFVGFGGSSLLENGLVVGCYSVDEIAGAGAAKAIYARVVGGWSLRHGVSVQLHDDIKRVKDSIRDDVYSWTIGDTLVSGPNTNSPANPPPPDPLAMRNSVVNTAFMEVSCRPAEQVLLEVRVLHFLNRQLRLEADDMLLQRSDTYSQLALVLRGEVTRSWHEVRFWLGGKYALQEGHRGPSWVDRSLRFRGPIARVSYPIMEGMTVQCGLSGFPGWPTRLTDAANPLEEYRERKLVFMLNGRTDDYEGSIVNISTGIELHRRNYDAGGHERDFDTFGLFVELVVGN